MKTYVVLLLISFPFEGPGIENRLTPDEPVFEAPMPQWLQDMVGRWQADADYLVEQRGRTFLVYPDVWPEEELFPKET